jgi:DNA-binding beta-propeller fold protein YncE
MSTCTARRAFRVVCALLPLAWLAPPGAAQENTVGARGPSTLVYPPYRHTYGIHKARTPHLKLFLGGRTIFANPQGLAAVKLARDDNPSIKGDDFQLTLFGLNAGRGEIIYNSSMQTLAMYGTHGSGEGQFDSPRGIAADVHGNAYVADTGNRRVVHLSWKWPERQLEWVGMLPGSYSEPWGVATAPMGGEVYISDRSANQVYRWKAADAAQASRTASRDPAAGERSSEAGPESKQGTLEEVFPDGITRPTALAVLDRDERWLAKKEDALFVVYEDGAKLAKFDLQGELIAATSASERDSLRAPPRFAFVALDYYGNVYVTDTGNSTIYKFKNDLSFLTRYGEFGEGDFQLNEPRGIAIWKRFGQVFVAEKAGAQYFFVGTDVQLPDGPLAIDVDEADGYRRYSFEAFVTEPTDLTLEFLSAAGAVVDSITLPETLDSGAARVVLSGEALAPDLMQRAARIALKPRPTYSSRRRFGRRMERRIEWRPANTSASAASNASATQPSRGSSQP